MVAVFPAGGGVRPVEGGSPVLRIVCLAHSFKQGGTCIAGREVLTNGYGGWIRPVSARRTGELWLTECLYGDDEFPRLLDIMDVPLAGVAPSGHQTENYLIDASAAWTKVGELPSGELNGLEERPEALWIDKDRTRDGLFNCVSGEEAAGLTGSLFLIRARGAMAEAGPIANSFWMHFGYKARKYRFKVTDPGVNRAGPIGDTYLCLSLTLPYSRDGRCHKLVAAVLGGG